MLKALPSLFPNFLGTVSGARVGFCDKFQREADGCDRDFMKKYDEDLNTTLIFMSFFHIHPAHEVNLDFLESRPVCFPQSHPLSLLIFRASSNRISKK